jgi:hypothetical protein
MPNRGLPRLNGGIAKAWREVWSQPCRLTNCNNPCAGVIESLSGPMPICEKHIPAAEIHGYRVQRQLQHGGE